MGDIIEFSFMVQTFLELIQYVPLTLFLAVISMIFASILGLTSAIIQIRKIPVLNQIANLYVLLGRAVPTMVMLYIVYFGLPVLLMAFTDKTGIDTGYQHVPPMAFAVVGLTIHTGAYLSEVFRAALVSVDKGQMEAALSIGMTWWQGFQRIIARQAGVFAMPLLANQFLDLIKGTSLVFTITVVELLGAAKIASAEDYRYLERYLVVALMYWAISIIFEKLFLLAERKIGAFQKGIKA
ncbi:MAG: polar amino acid transporter, inner rane subunit [Firmicutes bacterium]|nr:polar amino acid transporter, inner rane subunit [Bacillota bacterium]